MRRSEVGEAAGIFLVFIRDEENGFFKLVVMEFLKCDGGGDGGENRDVWRDKMAFFYFTVPSSSHTHTHTRTQFDGEAGRKFHLNKLPQLVEVFERRHHLQHVQQPGRGRNHESALFYRYVGRNFSREDLSSVRNSLGSLYYSLLV